MLDDQLKQLTNLGLNQYEAKAYVALLRKDILSATQVADLSGVPRQRIYDILANLVERGLASSRPGRTGTKYVAVPPRIALRGLLDQEQKRINDLEVATSTLIDSLGVQYDAGKEESSPLDYIEVLRGRAAINQRFAEIQSNCERELLIFTKPPYAKPPQENVEGLETLERKIEARSIYEFGVLETEETRRSVEFFIRSGEHARFVDHLPLKLVIVDERIVMFGMEDPVAGRPDLTIMVIEHQQLAQVMKVAFETLWQRGETFDEACERIGPPVDSLASA